MLRAQYILLILHPKQRLEVPVSLLSSEDHPVTLALKSDAIVKNMLLQIETYA